MAPFAVFLCSVLSPCAFLLFRLLSSLRNPGLWIFHSYFIDTAVVLKPPRPSLMPLGRRGPVWHCAGVLIPFCFLAGVFPRDSFPQTFQVTSPYVPPPPFPPFYEGPSPRPSPPPVTENPCSPPYRNVSVCSPETYPRFLRTLSRPPPLPLLRFSPPLLPSFPDRIRFSPFFPRQNPCSPPGYCAF